MSRTECFWVDSFTQEAGAGNPAGVVFHDGGMNGAQMQALAGQAGRESVFLSAAGDADWRAAYYTGQARIPLCGHDTIAAIAVLAHTGRLPENGRVRFITDIGIVEGELAEGGIAWMTQALPRMGDSASQEDAARALNIPASRITGPCTVVSTGTPFLMTPVQHESDIDTLAPDMTAVTRLAQEVGAAGIYVWAQGGRESGSVRSRCFAPGAGLPEDPVTGSASGALGAMLCLRQGATGPLALRVEQGCPNGRMGRAQVRIEAQNGAMTRVRVGSQAVVLGTVS